MYTIADRHYTEVKSTDNEKQSVCVVQINCDTAADIPTPKTEWAIGSSCFIIDTQEVKFLNSSGVWV